MSYPLPPAVEITAQFVSERAGAAATAKRNGNFWLPCPLCGVEFGGHESRMCRADDVYPDHIPDPRRPPLQQGSGWSMGYVGICPYCTDAKRGWDWPPSAYQSTEELS